MKSIKLTQTAASHGTVIGPPTGRWGQVPFHRWTRFDSGVRIFEHHPRATDYE